MPKFTVFIDRVLATLGRNPVIVVLVCMIPLAALLLLLNRPTPPTPTPPFHPVQALYQLEATAIRQGWDAPRHIQAGEIAYDLGDVDRAISHWEAAHELDPLNAVTLQRLADLYVRQQAWTPAVDTLRSWIALDPGQTWAAYQLGLILAPLNPLEATDYLEPLTTLPDYAIPVSRVLQAMAHRPFSAFRVGIALTDQALWPYAEHAFTQALFLGEFPGESMAYLALMRGMQGKSGEVWMRGALQLEPLNPQVYYLVGLYLRGDLRYSESLIAFNNAVLLDPTNPAYYAEMGQTYLQLQDVINADFWIRQAVTVSDYEPRFVEMLSMFRNQHTPLLLAAGVSVEEPTNADAQADLAWTLYRVGAIDEANAALARALAIAPDNLRAAFYQGRIALERGDVATARPLLERVATSESPLAGQARQLLAEMP
ncbi:MAG: tetratricopeptide repeat protein [Anaerolineae bacterium]|nr:tetratricopeptide repeat protein [Anaerolineae bacterium]